MNRREFLGAGITGATLFMTGRLEAFCQWLIEQGEGNRAERIRRLLEVGKEVKIPQLEGETLLREIWSKSDYEQLWYFYPHDSTWVNVTSKVSEKEVRPIAFEKAGVRESYHFHFYRSVSFVPKAGSAEPVRVELPPKTSEYFNEQNIAILLAKFLPAIFSPGDIGKMVQDKALGRGHIVGPRSIYTLDKTKDLTDEQVRKIQFDLFWNADNYERLVMDRSSVYDSLKTFFVQHTAIGLPYLDSEAYLITPDDLPSIGTNFNERFSEYGLKFSYRLFNGQTPKK